jgi:hypothetical protein
LRSFVCEGLGAAGFEDDLEKLVSDDKGGRDHLAAVVVDLNNLGDRIRLLVKEEGFASLGEFSRKLRETISGVIKESLRELARKPGALAADGTLRCRPLVAAGDDLIFLLPARFWPQFTRILLRSLRDEGHFACAGVAVAKHAFPVNRLVLMAEELCGNAKQLVRGRAGKECALDWHLHQESVMGLLAARRRRLVVRDEAESVVAVATRRPYTLKEFEDLLSEAESNEWRKLANRKRYALYEALLRGPRATRELLKYLFLRGDDETLSRYRVVWDEALKEAGDSSWPLWTQTGERDEDDNPIYQTKAADRLELLWLLAGGEGASDGGD